MSDAGIWYGRFWARSALARLLRQVPVREMAGLLAGAHMMRPLPAHRQRK